LKNVLPAVPSRWKWRGFFFAPVPDRDMMGAMKYQFTTKTLLLGTSVAAITCGGIFGWSNMVGHIPTPPFEQIQFQLEFIAPIIGPLIFAAFAIGRRSLSVSMAIAFALIEAAALAITHYRLLGHP
jgi:hypothetical protein